MAQRDSGYKRKKNDAYYTEPWVTEALLPYIPDRVRSIWEPACGKGGIAKVLREAGYLVTATDLKAGEDFLRMLNVGAQAVITNPPYGLTKEFIYKALEMTKPQRGFVAMLLRTDYDHGKTRRHLFGGCPQYAGKLVLTKRIVWFTPVIASPSENHSWFLWDWTRRAEPSIRYFYEEAA